jgi:V8-like Glu-specific endopeptidase
MNKPLVGTFAAALFGAAAVTGLATTSAGASTAKPHATPDFSGTVALDNCSGSLVKVPGSKGGDPALVLTNGHCLESGMPKAGEVITDQPSDRSLTLLKGDGSKAGTVTAKKVDYATMTDTDMTLYEVGSTYDDIKSKYGVSPLEIDSAHPKAGTDITVVSGYWKETYGCAVDGFVPELREADWTMKDSLRYTDKCQTKGGTSGSPIISDSSGKVIGINNTRNEDGEKCTLNNPCEVDKDGKVTVNKGIGYGQETHGLTDCVAAGNKLDLSLPDCSLPKPSA